MSFWSDLTGSKPKVPPLATTSLAAGQTQANTDNAAAAAGAATNANLTEQQLLSMMKAVIPNLDEIRSTASTNINSELHGELPDDVSRSVMDAANARGLNLGVGGSEFGRDLVGRDLGLTSLQLMDKGLSSAESWMSTSERMISPAVAELASMFVTPQQEYSVTNEQNMQQFQRSWMQEQIRSMPDPQTKGIVDTFVGAFMGGANGSRGLNPPKTQSYGNESMGSNDFGWNSGTSDMMDSGFNYGGGDTNVNVDWGGEMGAGAAASAAGTAGIDTALDWGLAGA